MMGIETERVERIVYDECARNLISNQDNHRTGSLHSLGETCWKGFIKNIYLYVIKNDNGIKVKKNENINKMFYHE